MDNESIKTAIAGGLAGLLGHIAGLEWELLIIWLLLVGFDILIGVLFAMKNGQFKSSEMKIGLITKSLEFILLFVMILIGRVAIIIGIPILPANMFIGAFCFKEVGSIIETFAKDGMALPKVVKNWFAVSSKMVDEETPSKVDK